MLVRNIFITIILISTHGTLDEGKFDFMQEPLNIIYRCFLTKRIKRIVTRVKTLLWGTWQPVLLQSLVLGYYFTKLLLPYSHLVRHNEVKMLSLEGTGGKFIMVYISYTQNR